MLELIREGRDVYYQGQKLRRVDQASKGEGKEVIDISKINPLGKKWISLGKLVEGTNLIADEDLKGREVVSTKRYILTEEEQHEVDELQARIDEIIENAKKRYVPTTKKRLEDMTIEELEAYIAARKGE